MMTTTAERARLSGLKASFELELNNILNYWLTYVVDNKHGGFYGEVDDNNQPIHDALKGVVLNARILWSFSAAYNLKANQIYLDAAKRAFVYLQQHLVDEVYGGVYWSATADGHPADTKKQVYALAFAIYGLAEYYKATNDAVALGLAISIYKSIEKYSYDAACGGYLEAFTRDWQLIDDLRLSDKDANEKKTMNTHLHILEAYTNLYRVWPYAELAGKIEGLIKDFEQHIINPQNHHLNLFMDENWQVKGDVVSYGHDIEASWLLLEAAEVLQDEALIHRVRQLAIKIAGASAEGLNPDGSLNYEFEPQTNHLIAERHWWAQAEAVVGYFNAWQISGEQHFEDKALAVWQYTQNNIIDKQNGEWFWGRAADGSVMQGHGKAGFWKCPYHNSRACIEMINRLQKSNSSVGPV